MGFPEAIARAQRDSIKQTLVEVRERLGETLDGMRAISPHNVALTRGEYDRILDYVVGAGISIGLAIDQIDDSIVRQAREQNADDLAAVEQEVNPKEE